ncbi:uncharacterized protein LOC135701518 [Ochlerotatus camptorhynchus]|uniref:uncharacterized protein LOC135701517 n=1 Tax=Ochlerotatus camptorhynchus TaxID=644619 RepID=UPI0031DF0C47
MFSKLEFWIIWHHLHLSLFKDTYYLPKADRSNPGGKVFSRINYIKQSERQRAKRDKEHFAPIAEGDIESQELSAEVEAAVQWLTVNTAPWTTVIALWEVSYHARKRYLKQYSRAQKLIDDYPQLREKFGFQLLDIDFRKLSLGKPTDHSRKWETLFEPIARYASKHGKDSSTKRLIEGLRNPTFSTDVHLLQLLHVLSTVLVPVKASKGFKPTVTVAQSDTFLLASNIELGRIKLKETLEIYDKQKIPVVPKLIVIGEALETACGVCFVVYKAIEYQLPTITKGIDVLLKLHIVFGLPVSRLSKLVWIFIEKFVYNSEPLQGGYLAVNKLVDYLRNQPQ